MLNFNGQLLETEPGMAQMERAWLYADRLFESIRMFDGRLPWLEAHCMRFHHGLTLMGMIVPEHWGPEFWAAEIHKIASGNSRIRLLVGRNPGGLYQSNDPTPFFLIQAQSLDHAQFIWPQKALSIGLAEQVRLPIDHFSNLKTLNSARYVAAAKEAAEHQWDDAILLNSRDEVCEATSSNVFWWEKDTLCTVPLDAGCVDGIARQKLIQLALKNGFFVREKSVTFTALLQADEIFFSNAIRGILPVGNAGGCNFNQIKTKIVFNLLEESVQEPH